MNILITGVDGFLGTHLLIHHLHKGDKVLGLDIHQVNALNNAHRYLTNPNFKYEKIHLNSLNHARGMFKNIEIVYHFAAVVGVFEELKHPLTLIDVNINATANLLHAIKCESPQAKVVITSSSEVYFDENQPCNESQDLTFSMKMPHRLPYPLTKVINELQGKIYHENFGLDVIILRLFNIIGALQNKNIGMVVARFIDAAKKGLPLQIFGDGHQERCFCDVRDLIGFMEGLLQNPQSSGLTINVGQTNSISIAELAKLIIKLTNSDSSIEYVSYQDAYHEAYEFTYHRVPDLSLLYSLTNYRHHWTLQQSLRDIIDAAS